MRNSCRISIPAVAEIPKWLSKSSVRKEAYKTLYEVMNPDDVQNTASFEKYSATRWLVRGKVIFCIITSCNEQIAYLFTAHPASTQAAGFKAHVLMDMLNDLKMYLSFHFVLLLVAEFDRVNASFQAADVASDEMFTASSLHRKVQCGRIFDLKAKPHAIYPTRK